MRLPRRPIVGHHQQVFGVSTAMTMRLRPLLAMAVPLLLAACSLLPGASLSPREQLLAEVARNQAIWVVKGPANYRMTIERQCFCPQAQYVITVADGVVTKVTRDGDPVGPAEVQGLPKTVPELFAVAAALPPEASATIEYDPDLGYPTRISVDPIANAIDDEYTIVVLSLTPTS